MVMPALFIEESEEWSKSWIIREVLYDFEDWILQIGEKILILQIPKGTPKCVYIEGRVRNG